MMNKEQAINITSQKQSPAIVRAATFFFIILLIVIAILGSSQRAVWSQAAVVEEKEKSEFEKKHRRTSEREAVKIKEVRTYKAIDVLKGNWPKKIELIGVELPELKQIRQLLEQGRLPRHQKSHYINLYFKARSALKDYVSSGDVLYIEQDKMKKNVYGNLMVYLYAPNRTIINVELVRQGLALPVKEADNKAYQERFDKAYQEAIEHKRGLYKVWQLLRKQNSPSGAKKK